MKIKLVHDFELTTGALGLALTPDGTRAFAACVDGKVYDVDLTSGKAEEFQGQHQSFASVACSCPMGRR